MINCHFIIAFVTSTWASSSNSNIDVKVDIIFNKNHKILSTGAHIPSAFKKTFIFSDGTQKCYYFPNQPTYGKDWKDFEINYRHIE